MKLCYIDFWPERTNNTSFSSINDLQEWEINADCTLFRLLRNGIGLLHRQTLVEKFRDLSLEVVYDPEAADVLITSIFGKTRYLYPGKPKIILVYENCELDFSLPNSYYISSNTDLTHCDQHFYCPVHVLMWGFGLYQTLSESKRPALPDIKKDFCISIISNPACSYRNEYIKLLTDHKRIDCFGKVHNNSNSDIISNTVWFDPRLQKIIQKYQFMITMENSSQKGYHTEKIVMAMKSGTIPVYWGDPDIGKIFNPDSFVNVTGLTVEEGVEKVKKIVGDTDSYKHMHNSPFIHADSLLKKTLAHFTSETNFYTWIRNSFNSAG